MQRAILIVDGAYFSKASAELQAQPKKSNCRLDVDKISEFISKELAKQNIHLNHKFWFDSAIDPSKDSQKAWWDALRNKQFQVQMLGVKTMDVFCQEPGCNCKHSKKCQSKAPIKRVVQAGVDVAIATKMLTSVAEGHCDVIVLLAGDGDFKEALRWVKEVKNKEIWVFGWKHSTSNFLREMASQQKVFDLSSGDFVRGQEGPDDVLRLSDFLPEKKAGLKDGDFPSLNKGEPRAIPGLNPKNNNKQTKAPQPAVVKEPPKILASPVVAPQQLSPVENSPSPKDHYEAPIMAALSGQHKDQPISPSKPAPRSVQSTPTPVYSAPQPNYAQPQRKKPGSSYKFGSPSSNHQNNNKHREPPNPISKYGITHSDTPSPSLPPVPVSAPVFHSGSDVLKSADFFQDLLGDLK